MSRLTKEEYKKWVGAFTDAFDSREQLSEVTMEAIGKPIAKVAIGADVEEDIQILIREADREGWLKGLVSSAVAKQSESPQLAAIEREYKAAVLIEPDSAFDAVRIFGEAMFDRDFFRGKLRGLLGMGSPPVLLVHGGRYSGKSWSKVLINHVVNNTDGVDVATIDLKEDFKGKTVDAAGLGRLIAERSGFGDPPDVNEEQVPQWIRQYCNWLGNQSKVKGGALWVVIDNFEKVLPGPGAEEFLYGFGNNIREAMPSVRLIVLSHHDPESVTSNIKLIRLDKTEALSLEQMKDWLTTFFGVELLAQQRDNNIPPDLEALQPKVAEATTAVLSQVDGDSEKRFIQMGIALRTELGRLSL